MSTREKPVLLRPEDIAGHNPYSVKKFDGELDLGKEGERGKGKFLFFFGKRNSGKSVAMRYMMYRNRAKFWTAVAMSAVANTWRDYETYFPKSMVYEEVDLNSLQRIWDLCDKYQKTVEYDKHPVTGLKVAFSMELGNVLIAIDDGSDEKNALDNDQMRTIAKKGRHNCVTYMLATQNFISVPDDQRTNADLILVGREPSSSGRQKLFKYFFRSVFDKFREFNLFMDEYTTDYKFMVFNKNADPMPSECMSVFKPEYDVGPFRIGHRDMWVRDLIFRRRSISSSLSAVRKELDGGLDPDGLAALDKFTLNDCSVLARGEAGSLVKSIVVGGAHVHTHEEEDGGGDEYIFCQACVDDKRNKKTISKAQTIENIKKHHKMVRRGDGGSARGTNNEKKVEEEKKEEERGKGGGGKASATIDLAALAAFRTPAPRRGHPSTGQTTSISRRTLPSSSMAGRQGRHMKHGRPKPHHDGRGTPSRIMSQSIPSRKHTVSGTPAFGRSPVHMAAYRGDGREEGRGRSTSSSNSSVRNVGKSDHSRHPPRKRQPHSSSKTKPAPPSVGSLRMSRFSVL